MIKRLFVISVSVLAFVLPVLAELGTPQDEASIRARMAAYADSRNKRDAHAEALCYTEDGDFRSSAGPFVSGRAAVEKQLTVTNPNYHFNLTITKLRFLNPTTAIVDAEVDAGVSATPGLLVADYVVVKQGGDWLIASGRIATKPAPRAPKPE
jgi:uncharacterized protein (TIGR02246 family)